MRSLAITGFALAALMTPAGAFAQRDSAVGAPPVVTPPASAAPTRTQPPMLPPAAAHAPSAAHAGAPMRGPQVTGGYRRPYYGYSLPQAWVAPSYFIPNYGFYGLSAPAAGFGWSRYYDDAVLTDRWGRVYDWRGDVAWDRDARWNEDHADSYGYRDERIAGGHAGARAGRARDYSYEGRWTGSWDGGPAHTYEGRFDGNVRPHWEGYEGHDGGPRLDYRGVTGGYGYGYGYAVAAPAVVTVIVQPSAPVITRTVSYQTEWVRVAAPRKRVAVRHWRPKPRSVPRCDCSGS